VHSHLAGGWWDWPAPRHPKSFVLRCSLVREVGGIVYSYTREVLLADRERKETHRLNYPYLRNPIKSEKERKQR